MKTEYYGLNTCYFNDYQFRSNRGKLRTYRLLSCGSLVRFQPSAPYFKPFRKKIPPDVGDKYLCVIGKRNQDDAFILPAYLTDTIKKGVMQWEDV